MDAKKCDMCGKFYESEPSKIIEIGYKKTHGIAWEIHNTFLAIDLCPDCLKDFKRWFERK